LHLEDSGARIASIVSGGVSSLPVVGRDDVRAPLDGSRRVVPPPGENMATGILVTWKTNKPGLYLFGIVLFLVLGIVLAIAGFAGAGGAAAGIAGVVLALGATALLIEFLATRGH